MRLKTVPPAELRALFVLLLIVVGLPTAVMGYEYVFKPAHESNRVIAIVARSPAHIRSTAIRGAARITGGCAA